MWHQIHVPAHDLHAGRLDQRGPLIGLDVDADESRDAPHLSLEIGLKIAVVYEQQVLELPLAP